MKLIVKHFPKHHRYHKILNKNSIKLSYSCMRHMGNVITKHNNKLVFQSFDQPTQMCNFRDKASCAIDGNCLLKCFVYQAQVYSANSRKYYLGTSEDELKTRYNNQTMSFRNKGCEKGTALSKYVWYLKDKGEDFTIKWSVASRASPYICGSKRCDLYLTEKLLITKADPRTLLNKRSEIVSKCRHRKKFTLKRFR